MNSSTSIFNDMCACRRNAGIALAVCVVAILVGGFQSKAVAALLGDSDQDGIPDLWEMLNNFNPYDPADALLDPDGDGASNRGEYMAGTDPHSSESVLRFTKVTKTAPNEVYLQFKAIARHSYSVVFRTDNQSTNWISLVDVPAAPTNRLVELTDILPPDAFEQRFYNVITWELR